MSKRFVVIVLDGFGIGAMDDALVCRKGDELSNTFRSILENDPNLKLTNLEKLGLMNAYNFESKNMKFSKSCTYTKSNLMHIGADTFMGHQEIMGTLPKAPLIQPFQEKIEAIKNNLCSSGYKVEVIGTSELKYLLVDDYVTVGDNIDADYGMAYNVTAPLDFIDFEQVLKIAQNVRQIARVNRVIPFGGTGNTIKDILNAQEVRDGKYIGIHAVNSKSYVSGYKCLHLGYGVDNSVQVPTILTNNKIECTLIGKVADIVINNNGKSYSCVDTTECFDLTLNELKVMENGFICTNIQQTDLAGHSQDVVWYTELLKIADKKIGEIIEVLNDEDVLLICADHGNDPLIGHNKHTREMVPHLIYSNKITGCSIKNRNTMSDIGATICDFFEVEKCQNGTSFLKDILT